MDKLHSPNPSLLSILDDGYTHNLFALDRGLYYDMRIAL